MTIKEYIGSVVLPFYDEDKSEFIPDFIKEEEFQTVLSDVMLLKYGNLLIRPSIMGMVKNVCNSVYRMFSYKYTKLYETLNLEYNPIENYSMTETESVTSDFNKGETRSTNKIGNYTGTTENKVAPYETESYKNESQTVTTNGERTDTFIENAKKDSEEVERELKRSGNIGVTTSQQMIESERKLALFSLYEVIAKDLKNQICVYMGV